VIKTAPDETPEIEPDVPGEPTEVTEYIEDGEIKVEHPA
jgi:hypothetical protein